MVLSDRTALMKNWICNKKAQIVKSFLWGKTRLLHTANKTMKIVRTYVLRHMHAYIAIKRYMCVTSRALLNGMEDVTDPRSTWAWCSVHIHHGDATHSRGDSEQNSHTVIDEREVSAHLQSKVCVGWSRFTGFRVDYQLPPTVTVHYTTPRWGWLPGTSRYQLWLLTGSSCLVNGWAITCPWTSSDCWD